VIDIITFRPEGSSCQAMEFEVELARKEVDELTGALRVGFTVEKPVNGELSIEIPSDFEKRLKGEFRGQVFVTKDKPESVGSSDLLMLATVYESDGKKVLKASAYGLLVLLRLKKPLNDLAEFSRGDEVYVCARGLLV